MFLTKENNILWRRMFFAAVVVAIVVLAGVFWFDAPLLLWMRKFDIAPWNWFDRLFDAKLWLIVSGVIVCMFYLKKALISKPKFRNERNKFSLRVFINDCLEKTKTSYAFFIFCAVSGACVVTEIFKVVIGRMRPVFYEALDITGFYPFRMGWEFHSMPSGHAAASFAGLVMLGLLVPRIKWATWTLATLVGISRVCYGAHWPSDVVFGAFIGMVAADFARAVISRRN